MGWAQCVVAGSNNDSPKLQMPTAAKQAFACIGMPKRLGVKDKEAGLSTFALK